MVFPWFWIFKRWTAISEITHPSSLWKFPVPIISPPPTYFNEEEDPGNEWVSVFINNLKFRFLGILWHKDKIESRTLFREIDLLRIRIHTIPLSEEHVLQYPSIAASMTNGQRWEQLSKISEGMLLIPDFICANSLNFLQMFYDSFICYFHRKKVVPTVFYLWKSL